MFRKLEYIFKIKVLTKMISQTGWEMVCIADHGDSMVVGSEDLKKCQKAHARYSKINFALTDYREMYQGYLERDYPSKKVED